MADTDLEHYQHPDQFGKLLGYQVTQMSRESRTVVVELKIREDHLSPAGKVHGGVISAFFDFACGAAVFTTLQKEDLASTVELKVNYFKPVLLDDLIRAEVKVIFRGNRLCVVHGFLLRQGTKDPIGMVTATFNVVPGAK